jgi:hypothetical protein
MCGTPTSATKYYYLNAPFGAVTGSKDNDRTGIPHEASRIARYSLLFPDLANGPEIGFPILEKIWPYGWAETSA